MSRARVPATTLAARYVQRHATDSHGVITLRRWRGDWYRWTSDRGCYVRETDDQLDGELYRTLSLAKRSEVYDVRHALLAVPGLVIDHCEIGSWLEGECEWDPRDTAVTARSLIHLPSREVRPATPRYFALASLGAAYVPGASQPTRWLAFLSALWPDDPESISALQEWIGYVLTPDTRHHVILLLIGPTRSGKGTILRALSALLGAANVASPTLSALGTSFGVAPLIGRSVAIIGDARLGGRADTAQIIERLLSISGEDIQTVDRKYREPWTGRLSTRFAIASNELPRLPDASDALAHRMIALRLTRSWLGKEDTSLTALLLEELPGILAWAIDGWHRLRARGRFAPPATSAEMIADLHDLGSPIAAWVRNHVERDVADDRRWMPCAEAYALFRTWAEGEGHRAIATQTLFGRDLRTETGTDRVLVPRDGRRVHVYRGLALHIEAEARGDARGSPRREKHAIEVAWSRPICGSCRRDITRDHRCDCDREVAP